MLFLNSLSLYLSLVDNEADKTKVEVVYMRHAREMMYVAYDILQNQDDAEDAAHNSMLKIIRHIDKVDIDQELRTKHFVWTVTKNTAIDMYRRRKRRNEAFYDDIENWEMPGDVRDYYGESEAMKKLMAAIRKLSPKDRDAFYLHYMHRMDYKEIADIIGSNLNNTRQRVFRAKNKIKEYMEQLNIEDL